MRPGESASRCRLEARGARARVSLFRLTLPVGSAALQPPSAPLSREVGVAWVALRAHEVNLCMLSAPPRTSGFRVRQVPFFIPIFDQFPTMIRGESLLYFDIF